MLYRIKVKEGKKKKKKAMIFHGCADVDTARRGCVYLRLLLRLLTFLFLTQKLFIKLPHRSLLTDECCRVSAIYSFRWIVFPLYTILLRFFCFVFLSLSPLAATAADLLYWWVSHLIRAVVMIVTVTCFLATDHHGRARLASNRK
jgi:hypothetical protein